MPTRLEIGVRVGRCAIVVNRNERLVGRSSRRYTSGARFWHGCVTATTPWERYSECRFAQHTPSCIGMYDGGLAHHDQGAVFPYITLFCALLSLVTSSMEDNEGENEQGDERDDW